MPTRSIDKIDIASLEADNVQIVLRCPFPQCNARIIPYSSKLHPIAVEQAPSCIEVQDLQYCTTATTAEQIPRLAPVTTKFYQIDDVWDFDNIGVSRPSDAISSQTPIMAKNNEQVHVERLLICSECDRGPLGFAGLSTLDDNDHKNLKYFLSENSVVYVF
ncbi:uncharacterized protein LODBEIA_P16200 [Lodderomyces beijingensis]|uniref:Mss4-like protein n=1 Tax=Lodderomyces beijingensis TaxID=1775926 RepID=A0ABP0ZKI9_9ASCO